MQDSSTAHTTTSDKHTTKPSKPLKIVFVASDTSKGLGDSIIALDFLFALKSMFECHLVVLANATLKSLLEGFRFYDDLFLLADRLDDASNFERINSYRCDFLISSSCKRHHLKFFESTNARHIITHAKVYSLLKPRFKTSPTFIYRSMLHKDSAILFLRRIDKRRFDSMIGTLDFTQAKLAISETHRARIAEFLRKELAEIFVGKVILDSGAQIASASSFGFFSQKARDFRDLAVCLMRSHTNETSYSMPKFFARFAKPSANQNIKNNQVSKPSAHLDSASLSNTSIQASASATTMPADATTPATKPAQNQPKFLVLVNPFCISAEKNLTPNGWLKLMDKISQKGCFIPVVATYDKVHDEFVKSLESYDASNDASNDTPNDALNKNPRTPLKNRIIIYQNDSSFYHLGALIEQMSCVIAPSTGTTHLASNLYVPTIMISSRRNAQRWGTPDARYVILDYTSESISQSEEDAVINRAIELLEQTCLSELGKKALSFCFWDSAL